MRSRWFCTTVFCQFFVPCACFQAATSQGVHSAHGNLVTLHAMLQNHYRAEDFFEPAASAPKGKGKGDKRGYGPAFIPLNDAYNAQFPMSLVADRRNKRPRGQTANLFAGWAPTVPDAVSHGAGTRRSRGLRAWFFVRLAQEFSTGARMCVGGLEAAETALGASPGGTPGRIAFVVDCRGDQTVGRRKAAGDV